MLPRLKNNDAGQKIGSMWCKVKVYFLERFILLNFINKSILEYLAARLRHFIKKYLYNIILQILWMDIQWVSQG